MTAEVIKKSNKINKSDFQAGLSGIVFYCKKHTSLFIVIIASVFVLAIVQSLRPYIVGNFLDALLVSSEWTFLGLTLGVVWWWVIAYATMRAVRTLFKWLSDRLSRLLMMRVIKDHRIESMKQLLLYPTSYFKAKKGGEIHEVISRANGALSTIIGFNAPFFSVQLISIIFSLGVAFTISPILSLILLAGVVIFLVLVRFVTPRIQVAVKKLNKELNKVKSDYFEIITNIFEVKRNTTEKVELEKVQKGYGESFYKAGVAEQNIWVDNNAWRNIVVFTTEIIIFIVSIILVSKSQITVGEVVAINLYAQQTFMPLVRLSDMWMHLSEAVIKIKEGQDLLVGLKEIYHPAEEVVSESLDGSVEFKNVQFRYSEDEKNVLQDISFSVKPGQTIALVGESGVGKSTTIELIGGFYFAQEGDVLVDGISVERYSLEALRSQIGYVSQEVTLFNDTVFKNIAYGAGREVTEEEVYEASRKARADVFINEFDKGYNQEVGERGVKLSVGQKQRIAIARTILRNPSILILDEPTSALDSKTEKFITDSFKELMQGRTTFVIAHRLSTVRDADVILVYKAGKIVEQGAHQDLMNKKGLYEEMYSEHVGLT